MKLLPILIVSAVLIVQVSIDNWRFNELNIDFIFPLDRTIRIRKQINYRWRKNKHWSPYSEIPRIIQNGHFNKRPRS